jgi:tetratricopeptide (TPR) repeat protein
MRALELARKGGDATGVAVISRQIGLVLGYQGRFGAAVKSLQDAVNSFRQQGENGHSMAEALNDLAEALARAGRGDDAAAPLDEAEKIQQSLKSDAMESDILNTRGDIAFYRGDLKTAGQFYSSALRLASQTKEKDAIYLSRLNVARLQTAQGQFQAALRTLPSEVDATGAINAHLALEIALARVEAEIGIKDYARATHDLNQQLADAQRAGVRFGLARIYYLLGTSTRLGGSPARAADYYTEASRLLDQVRGDSGAENILHRADVKTMWDESNRWKK